MVLCSNAGTFFTSARFLGTLEVLGDVTAKADFLEQPERWSGDGVARGWNMTALGWDKMALEHGARCGIEISQEIFGVKGLKIAMAWIGYD
jgi:hypothetical protein